MSIQNPAPTGITARYQGSYSANNTTNYYYWVQALYPSGYSQLSAPANTGAHSPAALTGGQLVNLQWNPAPGAIGYIVFKNTTGTQPANAATAVFIATSETGFKDDGSVATFTQVPQYSGSYTAHMLYNFAVDGGVHTAAIVPAISDTIPLGALVLGGVCYGVVDLAGPTAITIGTTAGSAANSILASTAIASVNDHFIELLGNNSQAATNSPAFQMTAAGQLNLTITVADATAGCIEVFVNYIIPSNVSPT